MTGEKLIGKKVKVSGSDPVRGTTPTLVFRVRGKFG
jgi:hypothetical protein